MENTYSINHNNCGCSHYTEPVNHKKTFISTIVLFKNKLCCKKCMTEITDNEYDNLVKFLHRKNH